MPREGYGMFSTPYLKLPYVTQYACEKRFVCPTVLRLARQ